MSEEQQGVAGETIVKVDELQPISFVDLANEAVVTYDNWNDIDQDLIKAKEIITAKKKKAGLI